MVKNLEVGEKSPDGSIYRGLSKDGRHIYLMAQEGPRLDHYDALKYAADLDVIESFQ